MTGSLWFYSKDKADDFDHAIVNPNAFKLFKCKAKSIQIITAATVILENATIAVPSKYLMNFWRSLETSLINCKVELNHRKKKHSV